MAQGHLARRPLVAFTAATLAVGLMAAPSAASASSSQSNLQTALAARAAVTQQGSSRAQSTQPQATGSGDQSCFTDTSGDTVNNDTDAPTTEPRADIQEFCVGFGPTLTLAARVAQPTDARTDPAWDNGTFVGWFIDTNNDGQGEFFAEFSRDANGVLQTRVLDIRSDQQTVACEASAAYTGWYESSGIEPSCIGGSTDVAVAPGMFYDDGQVVHRDIAPNDGSFVRVVQQTTTRRDTLRLFGKNRIETSVSISRQEFPNGPVDNVYIARQDVFADAVAGGVLTDGPILLVPSEGTLPGVVKTEIDRLNPTRVVALGGQQAVSSSILAQAAQGRRSARHYGTSRIETAVKISQAEFRNPADATEVYLARADVFADAVAGGVLMNGPVLLVPSCGTLPTAVKQEIDRLNPDTVYALGGTSAVCDSMLNQAAGSRPSDRLAGPSRFETAIEISKHAFPDGATDAIIARADVLADAVAGGVLTSGPILLVPSCGPLPDSVGNEISRVAPDRIVTLGGEQAVCQVMVDQAAKA